MPVVPCAHETTGKPPLGALPFGTDTSPDTATALPRTPTDRYSTRRVVAPARLFLPVACRDQTTSPWVLPGSLAGGL